MRGRRSSLQLSADDLTIRTPFQGNNAISLLQTTYTFFVHNIYIYILIDNFTKFLSLSYRAYSNHNRLKYLLYFHHGRKRVARRLDRRKIGARIERWAIIHRGRRCTQRDETRRDETSEERSRKLISPAGKRAAFPPAYVIPRSTRARSIEHTYKYVEAGTPAARLFRGPNRGA